MYWLKRMRWMAAFACCLWAVAWLSQPAVDIVSDALGIEPDSDLAGLIGAVFIFVMGMAVAILLSILIPYGAVGYRRSLGSPREDAAPELTYAEVADVKRSVGPRGIMSAASNTIVIRKKRQLVAKWGRALDYIEGGIDLDAWPPMGVRRVDIRVGTSLPIDYDTIDLLLESLGDDLIEQMGGGLILIDVTEGSWNIALWVAITGTLFTAGQFTLQWVDRDTQKQVALDRNFVAACYIAAQNPDMDIRLRGLCDRELLVNHDQARKMLEASAQKSTPIDDPNEAHPMPDRLADGRMGEAVRFKGEIVAQRGPFVSAATISNGQIRVWDKRVPAFTYEKGATYEFTGHLRYDADDTVTGVMVSAANLIGIAGPVN